MSTRRETVAALLDALAPLPLRARAMFGEYALYLDERVVALVCDDRLWIKPTPGARAALPGAPLAPPFEGGKDYLAADDALDDPDAAIRALQAAAAERPPPKAPKGRRP